MSSTTYLLFVLETLYCSGYIHVSTFQTCIPQGPTDEQRAGGTDERSSFAVLIGPWLFAANTSACAGPLPNAG